MLEWNPQFEPAFTAADLTSEASILRRLGLDPLPPKRKVIVKPCRLDLGNGVSLDLHAKVYRYRKPAWKFIGRPSKARREFQNYSVFQSVGLACATPVVCGETRDALGRLQQSFILTLTIPHARTLVECFQEPAFAPPSPTRRFLLDELARQTRRLHQHSFFHRDLVWRNILVTFPPNAQPCLWWIDCPRGESITGFFRTQSARLRDLGSLDKSASRQASRTERMRMLHTYLDQTGPSPMTKRWARDILRYWRRRWPDDWAGKAPLPPPAD